MYGEYGEHGKHNLEDTTMILHTDAKAFWSRDTKHRKSADALTQAHSTVALLTTSGPKKCDRSTSLLQNKNSHNDQYSLPMEIMQFS